MELNRDDLSYFIRFVLLDQAYRPPSGKRQRAPMKGFWMARSGALQMRGSDGSLRRKACIEALRRVGGMSVDKAAAYVAEVLGKSTVQQVNVIRAAYYDRPPPPGNQFWNLFFPQFLAWRKWVFESDEETLQVALADYERQFGKPRRHLLSKLMDGVRGDPEQRTRNRTWRLEPGEGPRSRIVSGYPDPESDWQCLATDLWVLGRLHAGIGEAVEAKSLLERALHVWKIHGHKLAHEQSETVLALETEIARLA